MTRRNWILASGAAALAGCARDRRASPAGYRIYVTNEASGDLSVIDSTTHEVTATVKLGKRPRGIHASPDGRTIYVALSGSPFASPGVTKARCRRRTARPTASASST
jgi:YVTN family beta-propeller protein